MFGIDLQRTGNPDFVPIWIYHQKKRQVYKTFLKMKIGLEMRPWRPPSPFHPKTPRTFPLPKKRCSEWKSHDTSSYLVAPLSGAY